MIAVASGSVACEKAFVVGRCLFVVLFLVGACDGGSTQPDAPVNDAGADAPVVDAAVDAEVDAATDAAVDAPPMQFACDLFLQDCAAGEKCAWVAFGASSTHVGGTRCVPNGVRAEGESCSAGEPGETTGYDNCAAGLICFHGACRPMCANSLDPRSTCTGGDVCNHFADTLITPATPIAGICLPECDPLSQLLPDGQPCGAGAGCYLYPAGKVTVTACELAGTAPLGTIFGSPPYINACLPGLYPRQRTLEPLAQVECAALCRPADVYQGHNAAQEGGIAPDSCAAAGAAPPDDPTAGESCRHLWSTNLATMSPAARELGYCVPHAVWRLDTDGDGDDDPYPRCVDLSAADALTYDCRAEP